MRKSLFFCGVVLSLLHTTVGAQDRSEYEQVRREADTLRQATVAENLPLSDSEEEAFWDLYVKYRAADKELDDQRVDLLGRLEESMNDLTDDEGNRLVTESLRIEKQRQALKQSYLMKFSSVLPGSKLFRYYQIETKLDALKLHYWTSTIPLASETE